MTAFHRLASSARIVRSLAVLAAVVAMAHPAPAQTSVRAPVAVNGVNMGFACDIANGWAVSTTAAGVPTCTQSVTNATNAQNAQNAVNATNAVTATTATTAAQAQSLNPSAQVNASQISGVIAASNLPAGSGSGGNTCVSANFSANRGGSFSLTSPNGTLYTSGITGSLSGVAPSMGSGQSTTVTITGSANESNYGGVSLSGSVKVTCNADGTFSYANYSWGGSALYHDDIYKNAGGS